MYLLRRDPLKIPGRQEEYDKIQQRQQYDDLDKPRRGDYGKEHQHSVEDGQPLDLNRDYKIKP